MKSKSLESTLQYHQVESVIDYLVAHHLEQPSLSTLANYVGLSESHLQRLFTQWAGVSPKRFLQFITKEYAKTKLDKAGVFDTALDLGLGSGSRLHDLFVTYEAMTPGEFKQQGQGLTIEIGKASTLFGSALLAQTPRGICYLGFFDAEDELHKARISFFEEWKNATISENDALAQQTLDRIFQPTGEQNNVKLLLKGSPFQLKVWEALIRSPQASLFSYGDLAKSLGQPTASRAAASAVASNSIAYLIPCHRVIRSSGAFNQYRWGTNRKMAMIGWEASQQEPETV